jgi:hypothetical protein
MLGCGPNIYIELCNTFFQEFLQSKPENEGARWSFAIFSLSKHVVTRIMFKSKMTFTSKGKQGSGESIPKINDISSNFSSMKVREFGNSTSSSSSGNDTPITRKKKEKLKHHINQQDGKIQKMIERKKNKKNFGLLTIDFNQFL